MQNTDPDEFSVWEFCKHNYDNSEALLPATQQLSNTVSF